MLPQWTIVGFSGHRELSDSTFIASQIKVALDRLSELCGPLAAVSSLALGADLLFLDEVSRRNLPLWLVLPFPRPRLEREFTPEDHKKVVSALNVALQIDVVANPATDDEAYMEAGEAIVEQADVMVVVWDGKPANGLGGTADVVAFARNLDKPIIWINASTGQIKEERLYHLVSKGIVPFEHDAPREAVEKHFHELDETARKHAPGARFLVQEIILMHLFASAMGLLVPVFAWQHNAILEYSCATIELAALAAALVLAAAHHRRHQEWIRSRIEAEICRSFLGTWQIRRRTGHSFKLTVPSFEPLCKNLKLLQSLDLNPPLSPLDAREHYAQDRLQIQIDYFDDRANRADDAFHRLKSIALTFTSLAALLTVAVMALTWAKVDGVLEQTTRMLSLLLPLLSAAIFSTILTMEYSRRAARYREMRKFLEVQAKCLRSVRTWNGLIRITTETEEQLIREVVEWHAYSRFVSAPH